jgi:hypothetical protein
MASRCGAKCIFELQLNLGEARLAIEPLKDPVFFIAQMEVPQRQRILDRPDLLSREHLRHGDDIVAPAQREGTVEP